MRRRKIIEKKRLIKNLLFKSSNYFSTQNNVKILNIFCGQTQLNSKIITALIVNNKIKFVKSNDLFINFLKDFDTK